MAPLLALLGVAAYALFHFAFMALEVWMSNLARDHAGLHALLPVCIDGCDVVVDAQTQKDADAGVFPLLPALVNVLLVALFGVQHSVMAREWFKQRMAAHMPWQLERSFFVAASSICILLMTVLWLPMPTLLFQMPLLLAPLMLALHYAGFALVFFSTFQIDHFELFGVKQVFSTSPTPPAVAPTPLIVTGIYAWVRHPILSGTLLGLWAAPSMTVGRVLFNVGYTVYIVIGAGYEERDLVKHFGAAYVDYMRRVPRFVPAPFSSGAGGTEGKQQ